MRDAGRGEANEMAEKRLAAAGWSLGALAIALFAFRSAPFWMMRANTAKGYIR